jgi:hypothetical protein
VPSISLSSELISKGAVQPVQLQKSYKNHIYQLKLKTTHTREREREREREELNGHHGKDPLVARLGIEANDGSSGIVVDGEKKPDMV